MSEYDYEYQNKNENENENEYPEDTYQEEYAPEDNYEQQEQEQEQVYENSYQDNYQDERQQYYQQQPPQQYQQYQQYQYQPEEESSAASDAAGAAAMGGAMGGLLGMLGGGGGGSSGGGGWFSGLASGMRGGGGGDGDGNGTRAAGGYGQFSPPAGGPPPGQYANSGPVRSANGQDFEYSRCNGRHKAVLVGINYLSHQQGRLNGCINDVHNVYKFLQSRGYQDITVLTDDTNDQNLMPTRANIIAHMQRLVQGAQKDDALFFHYSGHGTQADGGDHTESDGLMEAICPIDYQSAGLLHDRDSDYDLLAKPLPSGCRLTAVFDSCHSGTVMNLPYVYSTQGTVKEPNMLLDTGKGLLRAAPQYLMGDKVGAAKSLFSAAMGSFKEKKADSALRAQNTSSADVISFSGCKDEQTSADTTEEGQATGAMSYALIRALNENSNVTYRQLLNNVRAAMVKGGYSQKPQLSSCHPMDTDLQFIIG